MEKVLYYVIEKELSSYDDIEETTGNKTVTVYDILNNIPKIFTTLDLCNEDNTRDKIKEYLDDNGYSDETFNLVQL
jgi:hypothetical protein